MAWRVTPAGLQPRASTARSSCVLLGFGITLSPPLSQNAFEFLDALYEARSSAVRNTTIAPGLLNTVPRRVETSNKSSDVYSLKVSGIGSQYLAASGRNSSANGNIQPRTSI